MINSQAITWIEENLWPRGERQDIWMILDGARDRRIFSMLLDCHLQYACLYSQLRSPALEFTAPYLVQLEYQDRNTRRILELAWGNSWGIFAKCDLQLDGLRRHLRQFLVVQGPQRERLVFRYYDPRVLRVYLPTCTTEELRSVFGPIQLFWTEGEAPGEMLEFGFDGLNLARRALALDPKEWSESQQRASVPNVAEPGAERRRGYASWRIRQTQFAVFSQVEAQKFEAWVLVHLKKFFPKQCVAAGEPRLQEMVHYGVERAATYGITAKRDVCKYIDLMIVFGRDFDTDKRSLWAGKILRDRRSPGARVQALLYAARARLRRK